jgi:hypothetical protein
MYEHGLRANSTATLTHVPPMRDAALPVTLIVVGALWLTWYLGWFPDVDWIIAAGLVGGGVAVLVFDGVTKSSIVVGPLLIVAGLAWTLHDRYRVSWSFLTPVLLIVAGALMLLARHPRIPLRRGKPDAREP